MPYPGVAPKDVPKVDKCIADLSGKINKRTGKPYTKSEKIAICVSSIKKGASSDMGDQFWAVKKSSDKSAGDVYIYGGISSSKFFDDDTVTANSFKQELDKLGDIKNLNVYINSPGGNAYTSQAIHSMLARHPAKKTVFVDGLAASGASIIAMAGDKVVMPKNSMMMIHNASTAVEGNAKDLRKRLQVLEKLNETVKQAYLSKVGDKISETELTEMLDAETWMTADDALAKGFADEIIGERKITASATAEDFAEYHNTPDNIEDFIVKVGDYKDLNIEQLGKGGKVEIKINDELFEVDEPVTTYVDELTATIAKLEEDKGQMAEQIADLQTSEYSVEVDGNKLLFGNEVAFNGYNDLKKEVEAQKQAQIKTEMEARASYVDELAKGAKIVPADEGDIKAFVASLSSDQFESYKKTMDNQPAIVELGEAKGKIKNGEPEAEATTKHLEEAIARLEEIGGREKEIENMKAKLDALKKTEEV
jgi:ATP-dependent Clp protease, protease subunit